MSNREYIRNNFENKYYTRGINGDRLESDRTKPERKAKKYAIEIKRKNNEIENEKNIETVESVLHEIKEKLCEIVKCAEHSKSETTIDSLKRSKEIFKTISNKLMDAYIYGIFILCKAILRENISKEELDRLKKQLQELMEKIDKLNEDIISVGTTLSEEISQKVADIKQAYQGTIELVDARELDREMERWLYETPMEERERKANMVDEEGIVKKRLLIKPEDIDIPIYNNPVNVEDPEF